MAIVVRHKKSSKSGIDLLATQKLLNRCNKFKIDFLSRPSQKEGLGNPTRRVEKCVTRRRAVTYAEEKSVGQIGKQKPRKWILEQRVTKGLSSVPTR